MFRDYLFRRDVIDWRDKEKEIIIITKAFPSFLTDWTLAEAFVSQDVAKLFSRDLKKKSLHYFIEIWSFIIKKGLERFFQKAFEINSSSCWERK